jgi:hypothetical protein
MIPSAPQNLYSLRGVIPEHLRETSGNLEVFLEAYYDWLQSSQNQPSHIINNLLDYRDIDDISQEFVDYLQREFAASIPQQIQADPRKLYKQVNDIYRSKGSSVAFESLFNLLFNEQIELYYPRVDLLKPSDGKWSQEQQRYLNNDGFISDKKFIQDSKYYQNFSYVIKTGQTIDYWQDAVKKLLHPAGFAFFGQILIQSVADRRYSLIPPGLSDPQEGKFPIIVDPVFASFRSSQRYLFIDKTVEAANDLGPSYYNFDQLKFLANESIDSYLDITIQTVNEGSKTTISTPSQIRLVNIDTQEELLPEDLETGFGTIDLLQSGTSKDLNQ